MLRHTTALLRDPYCRLEFLSNFLSEKNSKLFKEHSERFVQVLNVKWHHILGLESFNYMENDER